MTFNDNSIKTNDFRGIDEMPFKTKKFDYQLNQIEDQNSPNDDENNKNDDDDDEIENKRNSITVRGLSGLDNIGNTCYLNSILQCLSGSDIFRSYIIKKEFWDNLYSNKTDELVDEIRNKSNIDENESVVIKKSKLNKRCKGSVTYKLYEVLGKMWEHNVIVVPKTFKKVIEKYNPEFVGYRQNDVHELLNLILDRIHMDISREVKVQFKNIPSEVVELNKLRLDCVNILKDDTKSPEEKEEAKQLYDIAKHQDPTSNITLKSFIYWKKYISNSYSIITELFTGLFISCVKCSECKNISVNYEPFTILTLPIVNTDRNESVYIEDCLDKFSEGEILSGDFKTYCNQCKQKKDSTKQISLWEAPEILIIHLNRFKSETVNNRFVNITKNNTKVDFPIDNFEIQNTQLNFHKTDCKYELYAVCDHRGGYHGGHYVSYCKNSINNKWYEFNDNNVIHIPDKQVKDEIITKNAYILFYKRKYDIFNDDSSSEDNSDQET